MTSTPAMTDDDSHVQHTWHLSNDTGDDLTIDLWTDGYTVRVDGGDHEHDERGRAAVDALLTKYTAAGYRLVRDYTVNDPASHDEPDPAADEPADGPEQCPECGSPVEYEPNHVSDWREGEAWLCTGCRWGQYVTA
jgi:hypothetical protein